MPEAVEVEIYRQAAETVIGRRISQVSAPDTWFLKGGIGTGAVTEALTGQQVEAVRRIGKLLILEVGEVCLGLRFGMTGILLVDDKAPITELLYSSSKDNPAWDRFGLAFAEGGELKVRDPRRLGGVELDPDEDRLGQDVFSVELEWLREQVFVADVALKARLLDQSRLAGAGNLIVDETLWRAAILPTKGAGSLSPGEQISVHEKLREVASELLSKGGSHLGQLQSARFRGAVCPSDGSPLVREKIAGRTTYWCSSHQR